MTHNWATKKKKCTSTHLSVRVMHTIQRTLMHNARAKKKQLRVKQREAVQSGTTFNLFFSRVFIVALSETRLIIFTLHLFDGVTRRYVTKYETPVLVLRSDHQQQPRGRACNVEPNERKKKRRIIPHFQNRGKCFKWWEVIMGFCEKLCWKCLPFSVNVGSDFF